MFADLLALRVSTYSTFLVRHMFLSIHLAGNYVPNYLSPRSCGSLSAPGLSCHEGLTWSDMSLFRLKMLQCNMTFDSKRASVSFPYRKPQNKQPVFCTLELNRDLNSSRNKWNLSCKKIPQMTSNIYQTPFLNLIQKSS